MLLSTTTKWKTNYIGISLTKNVKDLNIENHKTLKNESKERLEGGKAIHIHRLGESTLLKWPYC